MIEQTTETARAREEAWIRSQEQERLERQRRKEMEAFRRRELMQALGEGNPALAERLQAFGIDAETLSTVHIVPLVEVAWADGTVTVRERQQVEEIARMRGIRPGTPAHAHVVSWLAEPVPAGLFEASLSALRATLANRPVDEAAALRRDVEWNCRRVAAASGGFLGLGTRVSGDEEKVIAALRSALGGRAD